jgi:hypothetical protein
MLRLSCDPHPRDERACLPKISSPHSITTRISDKWTNSCFKELDRTKIKKMAFLFQIFE